MTMGARAPALLRKSLASLALLGGSSRAADSHGSPVGPARAALLCASLSRGVEPCCRAIAGGQLVSDADRGTPARRARNLLLGVEVDGARYFDPGNVEGETNGKRQWDPALLALMHPQVSGQRH